MSSTERHSHSSQQAAKPLRDPNRFSAAMQELKTAQELDPLSLTVNFQIASLLYFNHQYDESINQLLAMHDQDAGFTLWYGLLRVDPLWDVLRSDPRYTDLLLRIGYKV